MATDTAFVDLARREINDLHAFFEAWYRGDDNLKLDRVANALAPEFELLAPTGDCITRGQLLNELAAGRATCPTLTITVSHLGCRASAADSASLQYVEQHVENNQIDKRFCCALLRRTYSSPSGVEWVAIHERAGA